MPHPIGETLARRYFEEIFNARALDVCKEIVASTYHEHAAAPFSDVEPGFVDGPQATRASVRWLLAQFPDLRFTVERVIGDGEHVVVLVRGEGTNLGPIGPIPPTRKRFAACSSHWFRVADGQLAEHWATRDDLTAMCQLGIVRAPGPR